MEKTAEKETIEFIEDAARKKKLELWMEQGYSVKCLNCGTIYKEKPKQPYEDGHGGRDIEMCRCGSDLFIRLKEMIANHCRVIKVKPAGGTIVLKEHNYKYCQCDKGAVWTGHAGTECDAKLELLETRSDRKIYKCPESGLRIVCLKSTPSELKEAGFIRFPNHRVAAE